MTFDSQRPTSWVLTPNFLKKSSSTFRNNFFCATIPRSSFSGDVMKRAEDKTTPNFSLPCKPSKSLGITGESIYSGMSRLEEFGEQSKPATCCGENVLLYEKTPWKFYGVLFLDENANRKCHRQRHQPCPSSHIQGIQMLGIFCGQNNVACHEVLNTIFFMHILPRNCTFSAMHVRTYVHARTCRFLSLARVSTLRFTLCPTYWARFKLFCEGAYVHVFKWTTYAFGGLNL